VLALASAIVQTNPKISTQGIQVVILVRTPLQVIYCLNCLKSASSRCARHNKIWTLASTVAIQRIQDHHT